MVKKKQRDIRNLITRAHIGQTSVWNKIKNGNRNLQFCNRVYLRVNKNKLDRCETIVA